ncbi:MAG: hypothetical protein HQK57_14760, partial [Deltaproteobacteria bacterium]|nr:hypothetical protein [Deltaproteobacteria bacterium]
MVKVIPFERTKRSVNEVINNLTTDSEEIKEIIVIAKNYRDEWGMYNSELENPLEWTGILF